MSSRRERRRSVASLRENRLREPFRVSTQKHVIFVAIIVIISRTDKRRSRKSARQTRDLLWTAWPCSTRHGSESWHRDAGNVVLCPRLSFLSRE